MDVRTFLPKANAAFREFSSLSGLHPSVMELNHLYPFFFQIDLIELMAYQFFINRQIFVKL